MTTISGSVCLLLLLLPIISDKIWFSLAPGNNQLSRETKKRPSFYFLSCLHLQQCLFIIIIIVTNLRQNLVFIDFAQQEASFILLPSPAYISSTFLRILADLNSTDLWMASMDVCTPMVFRFSFNLSGIAPNAPTIMDITFVLTPHIFQTSLARSWYFSTFSSSFAHALPSSGIYGVYDLAVLLTFVSDW